MAFEGRVLRRLRDVLLDWLLTRHFWEFFVSLHAFSGADLGFLALSRWETAIDTIHCLHNGKNVNSR